MKLPALVRTIIRGTTWFSTDGLADLVRREKLWVVLLAGGGILVGAAVIIFMLTGTYRGLLTIGIASGHPELPFFFAILASLAFLFVTAMPLALSLLSYSRDTRLLLALPLPPGEIVAAKAVLLYLYCLPVNLLLLAPAVVLSAMRLGVSAPFVAAAVIHMAVSPLFPLSLAILAVLLLMKAANLSRLRVTLEVVGMGLGLALVVGLQVFLSRTTMRTMMGGTFESLGQFPDIAGALSRSLPPVAWAARGFSGPHPWLSDLLSLAATAVLAAGVLLLAPVNFVRDVAERGESRRERAPVSGAALGDMVRRRPVRASLVRREWAVLTSNSTSLFEAVGEVLILPLVLGIYGLILPKEVLGPALGFVNSSPLMGPIVMAVLVLMTNITTVTATSLSREGRLFALSMTMPIPGRVQLQAKLAFHFLLFLPAYLLDLGIVFAFFHIPARMLVFLLPAGPVFLLFGFISAVFMDLKRPLLKWTHPQQAMKQNMNVVGGMGGIFALIVILGAPAALALLKGADPFLVGCLFPVIPLVLDAVLLPGILKFADRQYDGGLEMES